MDALTLSTGTALDAARRWADLPRDERKRRAAAACRDRDTDTLTDLALSHLVLHGRAGAQVSRHTRQSYSIAVRQLVHFWGDQSLIDPSPDAGALWLRAMESAGLSASTVSVRLAGARALYAALRWTGAVHSDPLAGIRPARDPTPAHEKRQPYPESAVDRLLGAADPTERVMVLLGAHAGLRLAEMLALCWSDVDLPACRLTVVHGKGGKLRRCSLSRSLVVALSALPRCSDRVLLYGSPATARRRLRALCERAGVSWLAVHALRHTCGTRVVASGLSLEDAARHLGHSSIETTRVYAKWSDRKLSDAVGEW